MRWEYLGNGALVRAAAANGFHAFLSIDKNLPHQQNLEKLLVAVIVLDSVSNALPELIPFAPHVQRLLQSPLELRLYLIERDGQIRIFGGGKTKP